MKHERILITGANGLIGKELVTLLSSNFEVHALVHSVPQNKNPKVNYIVCDLSSNWNGDKLPKEIDVIMHFAQSENFRKFPEMVDDVFLVNTYSTLKLAEYGRNAGAKKFIYASSGGVYGNRDTGFEEGEQIINDNLGFYLGTKLCSEILLDSYKQFFDVNLLRFFFVYGSSQSKTMLIPRLIENIKEGNPIYLAGHDGISINPIYVDDAVMAIKKLLDIKGNNKYNIAGNETLTIREIANTIGAKLKKEPLFIVNPGVPNNLIGDIKKMIKDLHCPEISFSEVIDKKMHLNSYKT